MNCFQFQNYNSPHLFTLKLLIFDCSVQMLTVQPEYIYTNLTYTTQRLYVCKLASRQNTSTMADKISKQTAISSQNGAQRRVISTHAQQNCSMRKGRRFSQSQWLGFMIIWSGGFFGFILLGGG